LICVNQFYAYAPKEFFNGHYIAPLAFRLHILEVSLMKIKCEKFECEECGNLASIQIFYNKNGAIKYARARHYIGREKGKPKFEYHQQSLEYIQRKLRESGKEIIILGQVGQSTILKNDDLEKSKASPKSTMAGGEGFEPSTPNLGGWCSLRLKPDYGLGIRTELLAHSDNSNGNLDIKTLLNQLIIGRHLHKLLYDDFPE
jgi:hypothetical protein